MKTTLHVGKMLKDYMSHRNLKKSDVANSIGIPSTAVYAYEKSTSLQTGNIMRFCHALKYNFFMDIANSLPKEYTHGELYESEKDILIKTMTEENNKLKHEVALLKEIMMGRNNSMTAN